MNKKPLDIIPDSPYDPFYTFIFDVAPSIIDVENWEYPQKLLGFDIKEKSVDFTAAVSNESKNFSVSFPDFGGIRLSCGGKGFWNPKSELDIASLENQSVFSLLGGAKVEIKTCDSWEIKFYSAKGENVLNIAPENIAFGYVGGELKKIKLILPLSEDEKLFGLGERFGGINMTGKRTVLWNTDCGYHGSKGNAELWRSYKNVPFFHTTKGYSMFYNSYRAALCDIGLSNKQSCTFEFTENVLDLYVWIGLPLDNIKAYTDLTGKPFLPPKWAFGYMAGGGNGFWNTHPDTSLTGHEKRLKVLEGVIKGYSDLGTPNVSSVYGEGDISYQDEAYEKLKAGGTRMMNWNPPDYEKDFMQKYLPDVPENELPRTKDVNNPTEDCRNFIDFFNPNAHKLLKNRYEKFWKLGLRGGMLDFAELVPENALFANGMTGEEMHNFFPYWYGLTYGNACREVIGDDFVYYCRGGCAGSQHTSANFSGDQAATFEGLTHQLSSGLSMGCTGFSAWGADLGGYEMKPTSEVFARGVQFSAFQPLMRAHGTMTRCPWDYDQNAQDTYKEHYWLREAMVDYLYSAAISASKSGLPMMRAFMLEYFGDKALMDVEDQYIFCEDLLVAPVFKEEAKSRKVVMPDGNWYSLFEGEKIAGGREYDVAVTPSRSPVYIKSGAVIPLMLSDEFTLGASMLNKERYKTLLITTPEKSIKRTAWKNPEEKTEYELNCIDNGFELSVQGDNTANALLIYGAAPKAVLANGVACELKAKSDNITLAEIKSGEFNRIIINY